MITTIIYLVLAFIVLVALTSFAYASGMRDGYKDAQKAHDLEYIEEEEKSYANGYIKGFKEGQIVGQNEGYTKGMKEGFADGKRYVPRRGSK